MEGDATHKTEPVKKWLLRHPRFHLHFTPTSASWLNLVERWFAELTSRKLRRSAHRSVVETSDEPAVTDAGEQAAAKARPKPKAQANFTDPGSRIMKNSDGAYIQAYNAQAVVDEEHQVITAADVTTNASDALNYTSMLDQSAANTGVHPKQALVDAG